MTGLVEEGRRVSEICVDFCRTLGAASQHHHRLMKYGLNEWTARCTEIQLNIYAHSFVKIGMILKKTRSAKSCPWGRVPSHQCRPGVAGRQLSKYSTEGIQREPDSSQWCPLTGQMPVDTKQNSWDSLWAEKVIYIVRINSGTGYPGCMKSPLLEIFKTQPWTQPGCCPGNRIGLSYPWRSLIVSVNPWHGFQIRLVLCLWERLIRTEAVFCPC